MNPGPIDLRDYLSILWARKWIVIAVTIVATAASALYSYRQTPTYTSVAEVVVRPARFDPTQPSQAFGFLNMQTEQQLATSAEVGRTAWDILAGLGIRPGNVSAAIVPDSEAIRLTASGLSPRSAQATANAYARAYLDARKARMVVDLEAVRSPLEKRYAALTDRLRDIARDIATGDRDPLVQTQYQLVWEERNGVKQALDKLVTPDNIQVGDVSHAAQLPTSPSSPNHVRDIGIGFIVGLALGLAAAFFRERLDDRVRGRDDVEAHAGTRVLALIPKISRPRTAPIVLSAPDSDAAEAYKALRVRLLHAASERDLKALLVTSSLEGEGKTSTTVNLGTMLALAGKRVVLIAADLRRPTLHTYFAVEPVVGLADVLAGENATLDALAETGIENLWLIDTGSARSLRAGVERLGSDTMDQLLAELRGLADVILIDAPPLFTTSDVTALAPLTDGVVFVIDPKLTTRTNLTQSRRELELLDVPMVGVVVNRYNRSKFATYRAGYGYGYGGVAGEAPGDTAGSLQTNDRHPHRTH
jgi:capsular exopolysaccharide synthesis family protein